MKTSSSRSNSSAVFGFGRVERLPRGPPLIGRVGRLRIGPLDAVE